MKSPVEKFRVLSKEYVFSIIFFLKFELESPFGYIAIHYIPIVGRGDEMGSNKWPSTSLRYSLVRTLTAL